jgi:hypothetical protein
MIAGALSFTNVTSGASSSRYVGIVETELEPRFLQNDIEYTLIIFAAICAFTAGIGLGFIIAGFCSRKSSDEESKKEPPRTISDSSKKPHYPEKDFMPRSIKDYYKKNK